MAAKLGIDLIWFGVLIGANMQTSFMHPPFGFALFYLRGVAPAEVKTNDIYLGAIPWVGLQLVLVAILIFFPQIVTAFLDHGRRSIRTRSSARHPGDRGTRADRSRGSNQPAPQLAPH